MKRSIFSLTLLTALLFGCATAYQPQGMTGGFTETQLAPDVWRVNFHGNGLTKGERAKDFAMLRSAELAMANGFTHFAFLSSKTGTEVSSYTTPVTSTTTGSATLHGNTISGSSTTRYSGGDTIYISKPTVNNTVAMFKGNPNINAMVYDAAFICNSLGKKYKVVCNAPRK